MICWKEKARHWPQLLWLHQQRIVLDLILLRQVKVIGEFERDLNVSRRPLRLIQVNVNADMVLWECGRDVIDVSDVDTQLEVDYRVVELWCELEAEGAVGQRWVIAILKKNQLPTTLPIASDNINAPFYISNLIIYYNYITSTLI